MLKQNIDANVEQ